MRIVIATGLALALSSGVAEAGYFTKAAAAGKPLILYQVVSINPDCSAFGAVTVKVIESPEHGRVSIGRPSVFARFPPGNPRERCNTRRVPGTVATYVSQRGYQGPDRVIIETISATGGFVRHTFSIVVR
jgi:hypothetical protein